MNPTYFIKTEKLIGLYMTTRKKRTVTYDELQEYIKFIAKRFNSEHKDSKIVPLFSDKYIAEAKREYDHLFDFEKELVKTKPHIDLKLIAKEIVSWISWCVTEPCVKYSKEFFDKENQNPKNEKNDGKKL